MNVFSGPSVSRSSRGRGRPPFSGRPLSAGERVASWLLAPLVPLTVVVVAAVLAVLAALVAPTSGGSTPPSPPGAGGDHGAAAAPMMRVSTVAALVVPRGTATLTVQQRYNRQAFTRTNHHRTRRDRAAVRYDQCLKRMASRQARAMRDDGRLYHQDLYPVMRRCGLRMAGENVAFGYPDGRTVVSQGWMRSKGHRANILKGSYQVMAISAVQDAEGRWYVAQVFGAR